MPNFLTAFLISLGLSVLFTFFVKKFAVSQGIIDAPTKARKVHTKPVALLGGFGIYLTVVCMFLLYSFFTDQLITGYLLFKHIVGVLLGGLVIMIGGYLDDKYV